MTSLLLLLLSFVGVGLATGLPTGLRRVLLAVLIAGYVAYAYHAG
ncbi:MAG TPA: hypothetical protein VFB58_17065 [Chloroflexota bacterium]|nr:hypothetical protein [Chloroflexota bacterium]